jgi:hypothetical protein
MHKILYKFFSKQSPLNSDQQGQITNRKRKLILTSSTLDIDNLLDVKELPININKSLEKVKEYLHTLDPELVNHLSIIQKENFVDIRQQMKNINFILKYIEDGKFEKKFKQLYVLLSSPSFTQIPTIVCCNSSSLSLLKDSLTKKRMNYVTLDESK